MNKRKIIFTIIGGVIALIVIVLMWFLFFGRSNTTTPNGSGNFGSTQNRNSGTSTANTVGNGQSQLGNNTGIIPYQGSTNQVSYIPSGGSYYTPPATGGSVGTSQQNPGGAFASNPETYTPPPDVTWVAPTTQTTGNGQPFNPTPINGVNNVSISGTAYFQNTPTANNPDGAGSELAACTAGFLAGAANTAITTAVRSLLSVTVTDPVNNEKIGDTLMKDFLSCIARTIAREALDKMTSSVVDWLNTGFNGQPAFVQDYQQFFANAANQAAGAFIQGSSFSFLCSPIQNSVKIAIAQNYAQQRGNSLFGGAGGGANSCTLSGVVNNLDAFVNGDFSQGGWGGLLSYYTNPTNNAPGAYMYEQQALDQAQANAVTEAQNRVCPSGYIAVTDPLTGIATTACGAVEALAQNTLNTPSQELLAAKNFDEILSTLMSQLVDRTIYQGFANLSGQNGYASNFSSTQNQQATNAAQTLLVSLQNEIKFASQFGETEQASISDIENSQNQLQTLVNCWATAASSTSLTSAQQSEATTNAATAQAQIQTLQAQVNNYNAQITLANNALAEVTVLQTRALNATTLGDVQTIQTQLQKDKTNNKLYTQSDVNKAQQDRTTLDTQLTATNTDTASKINQCDAFGH
jgi:hypothetical protein